MAKPCRIPSDVDEAGADDELDDEEATAAAVTTSASLAAPAAAGAALPTTDLRVVHSLDIF